MTRSKRAAITPVRHTAAKATCYRSSRAVYNPSEFRQPRSRPEQRPRSTPISI